MRLTSLLLVLAAVAAGCSKKQPEVAPTPTTEPQPATPTPTAPPAQPAVDPAACEMAINSAVGEIARMVTFETDKYDVRAEDMAVLDGKVAVLQASPSVRLRLTGHADERYTDEYNLVLGTRRSEAVKDFLVRKGIDASRLETASLGETDPLDPGHNEAAWSRNRRVEFTVIAGRESLAARIPGCVR
jgi:peptidoglycan-associated lipoprotein